MARKQTFEAGMSELEALTERPAEPDQLKSFRLRRNTIIPNSSFLTPKEV